MDLIKQQLDLENDNIERCRKFLDPEEAMRFNERNAISP
jgi:hypothetical protein